jgi:hypothetical protein
MPRRLRSTVGLRRSPEGCMVCIVARSSMRTKCALCACGGVSVCLCVYSNTTHVTQKSRVKKTKKLFKCKERAENNNVDCPIHFLGLQRCGFRPNTNVGKRPLLPWAQKVPGCWGCLKALCLNRRPQSFLPL